MRTRSGTNNLTAVRGYLTKIVMYLYLTKIVENSGLSPL
ncbi:hypothetical protein LMG24076_00511 [Trinickia soli]|nr:hypothetical protein LMG24076_00511 [Trinickia soli]